ncbi:type VI secretion system-associated FHA domain protein [Azohydromonas australica]|uniref:type VI secretion system-associated FHA domain protein n=1 Tax=Azohydromonas australica TaxID=364039 RepID=UPI000408F32B|nr:type VI secretion system-associated FHA domain protein [Azohydromonas australica]
MSLTLRAVLLDDRPLSRPIAACFGREGGTIGRADENTLALPDPLRYISRHQARVSCTAAGFVIENIGSANPVAVRGEPLRHGHCVPLHDRDQLCIGAYVLEAIVLPDEGAAASAAAGVAVGPDAGLDEALWNAFCEGAGLHPAADPGTRAGCMRAAGQVLRHAVSGLLELMCAQPLPRVAGASALSNPLKVAPDVQVALELLLMRADPGFLDGPDAVAEALEELIALALATGAGTRAARDGVLRRFAPPALEARLHDAAVAASWWPAQRRARLWVQYGLLFEHLRDQARADFDTLFGQAFALAYEDQLRRLRRDRAC